MFPPVTLKLPDWIDTFLKDKPTRYTSDSRKMELVISLARKNIESATGGPFAAAVFNMDTGELIAPGVNVVVEQSCSSAHAEIMALSTAQKILGSFDLSSHGLPKCELFSSTAPCAMCLGAIPWSGVKRLVCGAADKDARAIGFDEGEKVENWTSKLNKRGIEVVTDFMREEASDVLQRYKMSGGVIYNSEIGCK
jgi:tRNA(Arg) A34 adenosine deaminase TadA